MPCTTILVGKKATYDGSTIVARNEDSMNGEFTPKRLAVVHPDQQPRTYTSVLGHLTIELPSDPLRYTALPNAQLEEGIWAAAGINEADVGMSATETITSNERVLAADPLVTYVDAIGTKGKEGYCAARPAGIGEEDMVTLVLPYIRSAREGVHRLGDLLERYGTYEMNGIAFHDANEVWWLETVGGHHWIARKVPDNCYVTMPNQLGIDRFDLADAEGLGMEHLCSNDLRDFIKDNHLDLTMRDAAGRNILGEGPDVFNPRLAFGSATDMDHAYNTPRAWSMQRHLNPHACKWDGDGADLTPESDDIPWCRIPERKISIEEVKYVLSSHYQGTPYDPYATSTDGMRGRYRCIGINRTNMLCVTQLRAGKSGSVRATQWITFGSNPFNALVPLLAQVDEVPDYFSHTPKDVDTNSFYWANRLIGALADGTYAASLPHVEHYAAALANRTRLALGSTQRLDRTNEEANEEVARIARELTDELLGKVLFEASMGMKNAFARSDF